MNFSVLLVYKFSIQIDYISTGQIIQLKSLNLLIFLTFSLVLNWKIFPILFCFKDYFLYNNANTIFMKSKSFNIVVGYNNKNYELTLNNVKKDQFPNLVFILLVGAIIGFINGFFGGGGGMICVPLLTTMLKLPEKVAHATTILIILPMSIFSLFVYCFKASFDFSIIAPIIIGFVLGGIIGAIALKKISNNILKLIFDLIILIAGVLSIIKFQ